VTYQVGSIAQAARGASVGVCPLRYGAGVQNKVLEYMALGLPGVTSRIGHEGLTALPGRDLLVADTPEDTADACSALLDDRERAGRIATAARRLIEAEHHWDQCLEPLVRRIHSILRSAP
jgi:glycosyltransferase involved in cell wall biosynthesis